MEEQTGRVMEFGRRIQQQRLKRRPLSDLTNLTIPNHNSTKPSKTPSSSVAKPSKPSLSTTSSHGDSCTGSNIPLVSNPTTAIPSTPPHHHPESPTGFFDSLYDDDSEHSKTATVYRRRKPEPKSKDKGKAVAIVPFSCPPPKKCKSIVGNDLVRQQGDAAYELDNESTGVDLSSKSCPVSRPQNGKRLRFSTSDLPLDFIEEQKKYFAEIDAFDLEEEVVSESELE